MTTSAFAGPGRHSVYTGRATNWPMVVLNVALVASLLAAVTTTTAGNRGELVLLLLLIGVGVLLEVLTTTSIRTAAGPHGVTVRFGVLGRPRCTYRLAQIAHADVIDLPAWSVSYGFWWTPRRTSCTVRSGPTLRLRLHSGRTVTITVPDAPAAVAVIREAAHAEVTPETRSHEDARRSFSPPPPRCWPARPPRPSRRPSCPPGRPPGQTSG